MTLTSLKASKDLFIDRLVLAKPGNHTRVYI